MLKRILVIFLVGLLVVSCEKSAKIKKPDNLISKDKMEDILYDLYIINASKAVNRKLLEEEGVRPEEYILTKYNIDSTQFSTSNTYYAHNTAIYQEIVDKVKARLEKEKETFEEIRKEEEESSKVRRDSIKEIDRKRKDSIKKVLKSKGIDQVKSSN